MIPICNYDVPAIRKLTKAIKRYDCDYWNVKDPHSVYVLEKNGEGFSLWANLENHPDRDRELWQETLKRIKTELTGYCYWVYSEQQQKIVSLLIRTRPHNVERNHIQDNNPYDMQWVEEQVRFVWQEHDDSPVPPFAVADSIIPADEQARMILLESPLDHAVKHFHERSKRVGLSMLEELVAHDHHAQLFLCRVIFREDDLTVTKAAASLFARVAEPLREKFKKELHWELHDNHWNDHVTNELGAARKLAYKIMVGEHEK